MPEAERIFISWSGEQSKDVAKRLQLILKIASDNFRPFVSDVDIAGGTRGLAVIADELSQSRVAILVINSDNIERPWLNFEAGSIAAKIDDPQNRVIPFLVNLRPSDIPSGSPLRQFQAREGTYADLVRIFEELANAMGIESEVVMDRCSAKLLEFAEFIQELRGKTPKDKVSQRSEKDMLQEVTLEVRSLARNLPEMISEAFERTISLGSLRNSTGQRGLEDIRAIESLIFRLSRLLKVNLFLRQAGRREFDVLFDVQSLPESPDNRMEILRGIRDLLDNLYSLTGVAFTINPSRAQDEGFNSRIHPKSVSAERLAFPKGE